MSGNFLSLITQDISKFGQQIKLLLSYPESYFKHGNINNYPKDLLSFLLPSKNSTK